MNEEEVKIKIVLPYLEALGIKKDELNFETTFSVKFGHHEITKNANNKSSKTARLDILVKKNGVNLFIIEVKKSGIELNDDDRDQGISYARLVHPIAPYVIVTNGSIWRMYDSITKVEIQNNKIEIKDRYNLTLPDSDRQMAIDYFLSYSEDNLIAFCHEQVNEIMKPLKGSLGDLSKKYIPELTIMPSLLAERLKYFEYSDKRGFLLAASSGTGKTTNLCHYALERINSKKPTLFFSGNLLEDSLLAAISNEFSWTFTEHLTPAELIQRLSRLVKDQTLIVVIDGIDEWGYAQKAQNLLNIIRNTQNSKVKFVFSCQPAVWDKISKPSGSDIGFDSYIYNDKKNLTAFNNYEFYEVIDKYRTVFNFKGAFEDSALKAARTNPFLLKIMFTVVGDNKNRNITFSSKEFFDEYFNSILKKSGSSELSKIQLLKIAELMHEENTNVINNTLLRKNLNLGINETLLSALFDQNILEQRNDGVAFYFQYLRDYLIAFHVKRWDHAMPSEFINIKLDGVQCDALSFYIRYASEQQMEVITGIIWKNAKNYLNIFVDLMKRHFSTLEKDIIPGDDGEIGFIGEYIVSKKMLGDYGIRRCKNSQPTIQLLPVDKFFSRSNLLYLNGAKFLTGSLELNNFNPDIKSIAINRDILDKICNLIKKCKLNVKNEILAKEALLYAIYNNRSVFSKFYCTKSNSVIFPICIDAVKGVILREKLTNHFNFIVMNDKFQKREFIKPENSSDDLIYYSFSKEEEGHIKALVDGSIDSGIIPDFQESCSNINELEDLLEHAGTFDIIKQIDAPLWPTEYYLKSKINDDYKKGHYELNEYFKLLFSNYLEIYTKIIDTNFPTLKQNFELRSYMPFRAYLKISLSPFQSRHEINGQISIFYEKLPHTSLNEIVICNDNDCEIRNYNTIIYRGVLINNSYTQMYPLNSKFFSLNGSRVLTDIIYNQIMEEWPDAANALRILEGVSTK